MVTEFLRFPKNFFSALRAKKKRVGISGSFGNLVDFNDLMSILGGPGALKNCEKSLNIYFGARSERVSACDMILVLILKRFLQIFYGFSKDLGGVLEGF